MYKRYPGSSLDQQAAKFSQDPKTAPKSPEVRCVSDGYRTKGSLTMCVYANRS